MSNSSADSFDLTMTNIMDNFFGSAMKSTTDGQFKAVCLSGIVDGDNTGAGNQNTSAVLSGGFLSVTVRPLTPFGNMLPDPRLYTDANEINDIVSIHKSMFNARADYKYDVTNPISFGQIVTCYYEEGSISNSDFVTLRFAEPPGVMIEQSFVGLGTVDGVMTATSADWSGASLLGTNPAYEGNLVTVSGNKKYLGSRSTGVSPPGFWEGFRNRIETHIKREYPELGFRIQNLGVTRDLAAAANRGTNTARANGSKHGAGVAQDIYLHTTKYGEYTSYKKDNPVLAKDQKLVDTIIRFMKKPENNRIRWGGSFSSGKTSLDIGDVPRSWGITEFHHFEFRGWAIPELFKGHAEELAKLGIDPATLTNTKGLGKLYNKLL
jgi:hypothetical protein